MCALQAFLVREVLMVCRVALASRENLETEDYLVKEASQAFLEPR